MIRLCNLVLTHWIKDQSNYYEQATARNTARSKRRNLIAGLFFGRGLLLSIIVISLHSTFVGLIGTCVGTIGSF